MSLEVELKFSKRLNKRSCLIEETPSILQRVSDGVVFKNVYISKRCGEMCIQEGDVIKVTYGKYKSGDYEFEEIDRMGIKNLVCYCK